jgi:hypothetical protein
MMPDCGCHLHQGLFSRALSAYQDRVTSVSLLVKGLFRLPVLYLDAFTALMMPVMYVTIIFVTNLISSAEEWAGWLYIMTYIEREKSKDEDGGKG